MRLSEEKLPIRLKKARIIFTFNYLIGIALIILPFIIKLQIPRNALIASGIFIILLTEILLMRNRLDIETNKITQITGLVSKQSKSVYYEDMTDMTVNQSIIGRIFGFGTLQIDTAGTGGYEIRFERLAEPERIKSFIEMLERKNAAARAAPAKK